MPENDFSDFLLKEYENIAQAFFNSREVLAKWVKYYLVVMAAPFSFIAFIYKDKPEKFNIFALPDTLSILIAVIGLIGLFLAFIIVESGVDSVLYARSVNGIRKYFIDKAHLTNPKDYIVLPYDTKKPDYIGFGDLTWTTIVTGVINSFYISLAIPQINITKIIYFCYLSQKSMTIILFVLLLALHPIYYVYAAKAKERKYGN